MTMRVLVTGASRGIGKAICLRLARQGVQLAACGSAHADELEAVITAAAQHGGRVVPLLGNLADPTTPASLVEQALSALGGLDAVVVVEGVIGELAQRDDIRHLVKWANDQIRLS